MSTEAAPPRMPEPRTVRLDDGRSVRVRPIQPSDAEPLRAFDGGLCEASHGFRYLGWMPPLSPEQAVAMATVDFRSEFALVATVHREGGEVVVADCRVTTAPGVPADLAIAVADDHRGVGLGPALIRQILAIAADHGTELVDAQVRLDNGHMQHVLRRLGFVRIASELGIVTFSTRCLPDGTLSPGLAAGSAARRSAAPLSS